MKKCSVILVALLFAASCTKYHVRNEIKDTAALSKIKKTGIIIRRTYSSPIPLKHFNRNLSQWLEPYIKLNQLFLIEKTNKDLNLSKTEADRFLQFSTEGDFQHYQTLGIVTQYLIKNKEELDKIKSENNLDSLIIFEVDAGYSVELQFSDFNSLVVIIDNNNKIAFMDRQHDKYETFEIDQNVLREELLDLISNRLIGTLVDLKLIKERKK
jgi:hypothetical protein